MLKTNKDEYGKMVKSACPPSKKAKDFLGAFLTGGFICSLGQALFEWFVSFSVAEDTARTLVCISLIFLSATLTAIGVFDDIAGFAGAGTLVPITGFANAVVSPAIEYKREGLVLGVGVKMFSIAGPVIVYGTIASIVYGFIYWICTII